MKLGIVPVIGNGSQVMSWIHIYDLTRILQEAINDEQFGGIYNAVAPHPVTQKQLMQTIARHRRGVHITMPIPAFVLKTLLGELGIEVLKSTTVSSKKLQDTGFEFRYPTIDTAVKEILGKDQA